MSASKPEAGQWWIAERAMTGDTAEAIAVRIQHILPNGHIVVETYPGTFCVWKDVNNWHHEPRCTGWDWVVPAEPMPVNQPEPDEWVVQDRVPVRIGDYCWWVSNDDPLPNYPSEMWLAHQYSLVVSRKNRHGDKSASGKDVLHVMCRRRDLPPAEPEQWPKYWTTDGNEESIAFIRQVSANVAEIVYVNANRKPCEWPRAWTTNDQRKRKQLTEAEAMALLNKPQPQPAKTRVRLWINAVDGSVYFGESSRLRTDCEIHYDAEAKKFYVES